MCQSVQQQGCSRLRERRGSYSYSLSLPPTESPASTSPGGVATVNGAFASGSVQGTFNQSASGYDSYAYSTSGGGVNASGSEDAIVNTATSGWGEGSRAPRTAAAAA